MVYDELLMQWFINFREHTGFWFSNFPITLNIDWLDLGKHTYTCMVADVAGHISSYTVIIQVVETLTTTPTTPTTTETTTITQTPTSELSNDSNELPSDTSFDSFLVPLALICLIVISRRKKIRNNKK